MSPDNAWLRDMVKHARKALERTAGITREQFLADTDKHLAICYLIMVIGEAAAQVSDETRASMPNLAWGQIVNMRNRLIHHYFKTDLQKVWDVVEDDLQPLIDTIEPYLQQNPPPTA